jgi:signal transduction histidine kinase
MKPPLRGATLALILVCLALAGVSALETRQVSVAHGAPLPWGIIFKSTLPRWVLLAATLPFALRLAMRFPTRRPLTIAIHITLFTAISFAHAAIIAWTLAFANPISYLFPWSARLLRAWYSAMPIMVGMYGAVLAAAWAMNEARERELRSVRASQLEAQLQASQLAVLRARVHPHFLYNTLNGIAALVVDQHTTEAVAAIEQLSELLHASLRDDGRNVISIREEVGLAERYLALQQMRFGNRLAHEVIVSGDVADCEVPVLLLQPLVENAVMHGLEADQSPLHVAIAAARYNGGVELRVENDGVDLDESTRNNGHGVGLAATRARLETAYGDRASLELLPRDGGGVIVRLRLPA